MMRQLCQLCAKVSVDYIQSELPFTIVYMTGKRIVTDSFHMETFTLPLLRITIKTGHYF